MDTDVTKSGKYRGKCFFKKLKTNMSDEPTIRLQMDLGSAGVRKVYVFADNPDDRAKALGWLNEALHEIEALEQKLMRCAGLLPEQDIFTVNRRPSSSRGCRHLP